MQRYHFHFKWRDDAVFDEEGIELENFPAAYLRACELVHQVRRRFPAAGSDWWIVAPSCPAETWQSERNSPQPSAEARPNIAHGEAPEPAARARSSH